MEQARVGSVAPLAAALTNEWASCPGRRRLHAMFAHLMRDNGVPQGMTTCRTASIDGDVIEGHVLVVDIRRHLGKRPDAVGLADPGMPYGSPGMGPQEDRRDYGMFLTSKSGSSEVFSTFARN